MRVAGVLLFCLTVSCVAPAAHPDGTTSPPRQFDETSNRTPRTPSLPPAKANATPPSGPIARSISGVVAWNRRPQPGALVEVSELGAPARGRALASAVAGPDGSFSIPFMSRSAAVGAFVPAHGVFLEGGEQPMSAGSDGTTLQVGRIDLRRAVTGLSVRDGDTYAAGPVTITWDAVPETTSYCVAVWPVDRAAPAGSCPDFAHAFGEVVMAARYTTDLAPGRYVIAIVALTDVVVGELRIERPGLVFTVR